MAQSIIYLEPGDLEIEGERELKGQGVVLLKWKYLVILRDLKLWDDATGRVNDENIDQIIWQGQGRKCGLWFHAEFNGYDAIIGVAYDDHEIGMI